MGRAARQACSLDLICGLSGCGRICSLFLDLQQVEGNIFQVLLEFLSAFQCCFIILVVQPVDLYLHPFLGSLFQSVEEIHEHFQMSFSDLCGLTRAKTAIAGHLQISFDSSSASGEIAPDHQRVGTGGKQPGLQAPQGLFPTAADHEVTVRIDQAQQGHAA